MQLNLRSFKQLVACRRKLFTRFIKRLEKKPPPQLYTLLKQTEAAVWKETECLQCGNCCKQMSPTYKVKDIKRIAAHLDITPLSFKEKYLAQDDEGDWVNKQKGCMFLDRTDNKCSIYPVRPADCAGFPHLVKKSPQHYVHIYIQNIEYCPATFKLVEKMMAVTGELKPKK